MALCRLCLGLTPEIRQYKHHTSFEALRTSSSTCELCRLIADILEKNGDRKKAEDYRETINNKRDLVNDTSITISVNQHDLPKEGDIPQSPYRLVITCGPLHREGMFKDNKPLKAPISVLSIYAEEASDAAQLIATRPVSLRCDTDRAFELMRCWIDGCVDNHDACQLGFVDGKNKVTANTLNETTKQLKALSAGEEPPLPSRILDLAASGTPHQICLRETNRTPGVYAALSHCWGKSQHLTTTKSTLAQRQASIQLSSLPLTFQHAVTITRRLGLRYLWIDSLCIIQDDIADWEIESALMGEVYRNAHFTIAAAFAVDGDGGCFEDRSIRSRGAIAIPLTIKDMTPGKTDPVWYVHEPHGNYASSVWQGPLQKRAWTLQERCLSRRIIHFAADQMYFECNKSLQFEDRRPEAEHSSQYLSFSSLYFMAMHPNPFIKQLAPFLLTTQWVTIVESFTGRGLTKDDDALPALSGVATHLAAVCGTQYVAGLWSGSVLPDMLLWRVPENHEASQVSRPASYRAPSWSWASLKGPILFMHAGSRPLEANHKTNVLDLKQLKAIVSPSGRDPHGKLKSGTLEAKGWLIEVQDLGTLAKKKFEGDDYTQWGQWVSRKAFVESPNVLLTGYNYMRSTDRAFWGAVAFDDGAVSINPMFALLVKQKDEAGANQTAKPNLETHITSFFILLLTPTNHGVDQYRRIGMGHLVQVAEFEFGEKQALTIV